MDATLEELLDHGYAGLAIERVAARAGVSKATIYRHWDGKADLVSDSVTADRPTPEPVATGDVRADVLTVLQRLAARSAGASGALLPLLVDAAERDAELASLHHDFVQRRRQVLVDTLRDAVVRGDLAPDTDLEVTVDLLISPVIYRRYVSRDPVTDAFLEEVVDTVLGRG